MNLDQTLASVGTATSIVVATCALIAMFLPAPQKDGSKVYAALYTAINAAACNAGHARNATTP